MADPILWKQLAESDSECIARHSGAKVLADGVYEVKILNRLFSVDSRRHTIKPAEVPDDNSKTGLFSIAVVMYLLQSRRIDHETEWVSPLDLPGGAQFFRASHEPPVGRIESRFGHSRDDFYLACQACAGEPIPFADVAFSFRVFPHLPMAILLWLADDEFPARASILVDKSTHRQLPLDALFAAIMLLENAVLDRKTAGPDGTAA